MLRKPETGLEAGIDGDRLGCIFVLMSGFGGRAKLGDIRSAVLSAETSKHACRRSIVPLSESFQLCCPTARIVAGISLWPE